MIDLAAALRAPPAERIAVSAVVLAAGMSTRMGGEFKLLLDCGGEPMIRRTVRHVLAIEPMETVVVTGHRADEVEAALAGLLVAFARNPDHRRGQPTSVAAGVRALKAHCHAVMIALGDQPLVGPDDLRALVEAYRTIDRGSILVPHHEGRRGNPILFAGRHIPSVARGDINVGCRRLIETHGDEVAKIEFEHDVFTQDCDTPEDYDRLLQRLKVAPA